MNNEQTHILDTTAQIDIYRNIVLLQGIELELIGIRMTRGRTCYSMIKEQFGLKGNKQKVRDQLAKILGRE